MNRKITLNDISVTPPTGTMENEKIDSRCNTDEQRAQLIGKLKECQSNQAIDALFSNAQIDDYAMRSAILRECMDAVYILSAGIQDPRIEEENLSRAEIDKLQYDTEKRTFLRGRMGH